ncbi:MAG: YfiR family protein [Kangiellaceae bacterium]|nr:YfiR family protein [Kangiellaceae bacterium]
MLASENPQSVNQKERTVKANLLWRLPNYIEWSQSSNYAQPDKPYKLCIYDDSDYFAFVMEYLKGSKIKGSTIEFSHVKFAEDFGGCDVAYLGDIDQQSLGTIMASGLYKNTLLIASSTFSAKDGVHLRLYVGADGRLAFEENQKAFAEHGSRPKVRLLKFVKRSYTSAPLIDSATKQQPSKTDILFKSPQEAEWQDTKAYAEISKEQML